MGDNNAAICNNCSEQYRNELGCLFKGFNGKLGIGKEALLNPFLGNH